MNKRPNTTDNLCRYVSVDDVTLTHEQFLRVVADRIYEDLDAMAQNKIPQNPQGYTEREAAEKDFQKWKRGDIMMYAGYTVKPSNAFLTKGTIESHAWVICKDGCNAMPGCTWAPSMSDASMMIDILEAVGGDDQKFWHLNYAILRAVGKLK